MPNRLGRLSRGSRAQTSHRFPGSLFGPGSPTSFPFLPSFLLAFRQRFCLAAKESGVLAQNPPGVAVAGKAPGTGE